MECASKIAHYLGWPIYACKPADSELQKADGRHNNADNAVVFNAEV